MASLVGRANGGEGAKDGDGLRPWLETFLHATYFECCSLHADSYRNQCNMFCTDCMGNPVCHRCARIYHEGHTVIQVRKSRYHEAVRAREMQEFIDISDIQTYITNKAAVVFLNKRRQTNPRKQVNNACEVCRKTLTDPFRFCSIGCMVQVQKTRHSGSPRIGVPVPDQKAADGCNPCSAAADATPSTKPEFDHNNSRKRKGTPRRALSFF